MFVIQKTQNGEMPQTRAVLNRTQLDFLEQVIVRYGMVVTYDEIAALVPGVDQAAKRQFVSRLSQAGWLVRIKKGVYQVADLASLGTVTLSRYAVAQLLAPHSYVSFEAALQFHGLHDQLMQSVTSVALQQRRRAAVAGIDYHFVRTAPKFFFGYEQHVVDGQTAQIATKEKALIDMVQLHRTQHTGDRVAEILADSAHQLDLSQLEAHLRRANLTTQRIFGWLFDTLSIPYDPALAVRASASSASSRFTASSTAYDPKWRLYYDQSIIERYASA